MGGKDGRRNIFFFFFLSFLLGVDRPPASTSSIHYLSPFFLSLRDSIVEVVFSFLPSTVYPVLFENVLEAKVLREKKLPYYIFLKYKLSSTAATNHHFFFVLNLLAHWTLWPSSGRNNNNKLRWVSAAVSWGVEWRQYWRNTQFHHTIACELIWLVGFQPRVCHVTFTVGTGPTRIHKMETVHSILLPMNV